MGRGPRDTYRKGLKLREFIVPSNIAKLEILAKDIFEHRTENGGDDTPPEPCALNYAIDFLDLFLEIQTMFSLMHASEHEGEPSPPEEEVIH